MITLTTPLQASDIKKLKIGDAVSLTGYVYTARDAAHQRFDNLLKNGETLPLDLNGAVIFYAGPSPAQPGQPIGAIGPTTSYRMDSFTPLLMEKTGLKGMIGKGKRSVEVHEAIVGHHGVYFAAIGGIAALLCEKVESSEVVLYPELGTEAVRKLFVRDFPLIVMDCHEK